ncbi:hypothetical protein [Streptomyces cadmiisoli]|uniref:hypothetical protein n=1 Tax=Streptomyces cadmiisoli TaxID=2184053 RepID=UPI0036679201
MTKKRRNPSDRAGPSRFQGSDQHGWSPDVDDSNQDNPSAHRSFHTEKYAGPKRSRRAAEADKEASTAGTPVRSDNRRGEEMGGKDREKGMHDRGRRGRSQRPSGSKDAETYTGIDPQEPDNPAGQ